MMNWLKNLWNAQRNAAALEESLGNESHLEVEISDLGATVNRLSSDLQRLTFERNQYSALTATLAAEYLRALGADGVVEIPDSIKEAHMLRGVATGWKYADDVKYGKGMFDKQQRMEERATKMDEFFRNTESEQWRSAAGLANFGIPATPEDQARVRAVNEEWAAIPKLAAVIPPKIEGSVTPTLNPSNPDLPGYRFSNSAMECHSEEAAIIDERESLGGWS